MRQRWANGAVSSRVVSEGLGSRGAGAKARRLGARVLLVLGLLCSAAPAHGQVAAELIFSAEDGAPLGRPRLERLGRESRRALAVPYGEPLRAEVRTSPGARVELELGAPLSALVGLSEVRLLLSARERLPESPAGAAESAPWVELIDRRFAARDLARGRAWRPLVGAIAPALQPGPERDQVHLELRLELEAVLAETGTDGPRAALLLANPALVPPRFGERRPNLLLVTADGVRRDQWAALDHPHPTPFAARMGAEGLVFERAWAAGDGPLDSLEALFGGGLMPALLAAGYRTGAALGHGDADRAELLGAGFERWRHAPGGGAPQGPFGLAGDEGIDGADPVRGARRWLEEWSLLPERPWFLWLHLGDARAPRPVPAEYLAHHLERWDLTLPRRAADPADVPLLDVWPRELDFLEGVSHGDFARFQHGVAGSYADVLAENLFATVERLGDGGRTGVVLLGTRGQVLGERGGLWGNLGPWPEVFGVPLVVRAAPRLGEPGPRGRMGTPVGPADAAATLAVWAGLGPLREAETTLETWAARELEVGAPGERRLPLRLDGERAVGAVDGNELAFEIAAEDVARALGEREDSSGRRVVDFEFFPSGARLRFRVSAEETYGAQLEPR